MHAFDIYGLCAALASGALAVLYGVVWRAQRLRWSLIFGLAFLMLAVLYGFDAQLRPRNGLSQPLSAFISVATAVALTLGMIDYVQVTGRAAWVLRVLSVALGVLLIGLIFSRQITRIVGFGVLSMFLVAQAALALRARWQERGRGHGLVFLALISSPAVIGAAALGLFDMALLRYAAAVPTTMMGMTVLTTGLLRAQQQARDELHRRRDAEEALRRFNEALEQRVLQRTAELHEMVAALESFNRSISHDLRGPLGGIAGVSRLASEALEAGDTATARRLLPSITQQAESSADLVASLLALARVNDSELSPRPVPLNDVVEETLAHLRLADPDAQPLPVHVAPLPTVEADPGLIRQVYVNLIGNALKFSRDAGAPQVDVGAYPEGGGHVMFVRDNGIGFDPASAERLFEPFQQLHATSFDGHGVGLSIVKRVVERHGGRVWARSGPGGGAAFYFWLGPRLAVS